MRINERFRNAYKCNKNISQAMKRKYFLALAIFGILLVSGCISQEHIGDSPTLNTFSNQQINNPEQVTLPIDNADEAINYSLSLEQVRRELNTPLEGRMAGYNEYNWWAVASNNSTSQYKDANVWFITWFKGPGNCQSPHGCQIRIASNGTVIENISCGDGWNCK